MSIDDWAGRTIVVTGCSSGIGLSTAEILLERGARVIGLDRNPPEIDVEFHRIDLNDSASITAAVASMTGPIDGLVNAAGVSAGIGDPLAVVGINFVGLRELTEQLLPLMADEAYVVCTSSLAAGGYREHQVALTELLATETRASAMAWCEANPEELGRGYSLSKEAVIQYVATSAVRFAGRGVRINATAPGVTETPIIAGTLRALGQQYLDAIPKPLGRIARPQEQADVLIFLVGSGASYISGQTIWVDGGYSAGVDSGEIEPFAIIR